MSFTELAAARGLTASARVDVAAQGRRDGETPRRRACSLTPRAMVESVKVSVLAYVPVRSGSVAATGCLNATRTASLATGPPQVSRVSGLAAPGTGANAVSGLAALVALTCSACAIT